MGKPRLLSEPLSLNGDGQTFGSNVDGSVTPQFFEARPPKGQVWRLHQGSFCVGSAVPLTMGDYCGLPALANGILLDKVQGVGANAVVLDPIVRGSGVKILGDWLCYAPEGLIASQGAAPDFISYVWHFREDFDCIELDGDKDQALRMTIQDDLTTVQTHVMVLQGVKT